MISNKRGSTLIMVIAIVAILSMLGLTVLTISVTDKKQVVEQDEEMQTYYLARAGADAVAEHIIHNPLSINSIRNKESAPYSTIGNGDIVVSVKELTPGGDIEILSTGTNDNHSTDIKLRLDRVSMNHAIFSFDDLDVEKFGEIDGDIGSNGDIYGPGDRVIFSGNKEEDKDFHMAPIDFPEFSDYATVVDGESYKKIASSGILDDSLLAAQSEMVFDTSEGDLELLVLDDLSLKDKVIVEGNNSVYLYVDEGVEVEFKTKYDSTDHYADQFIIYLGKNALFNVQANYKIRVRIIGPEARVYIQSASSTIIGSILCKVFTNNSTPNITYEPSATDVLDLGYKRGLWE